MRLPPGEPCREGECLPRAGAPGVWVAMRSNGAAPGTCGGGEGIPRLLMHVFIVHVCIHPVAQPVVPGTRQPQLLMGAYSVPASVGTRPTRLPPRVRKGDPGKGQHAESCDGEIHDAVYGKTSKSPLGKTLTLFPSPLWAWARGPRACPGTGARDRGGARWPRLGRPPLSLPWRDERSPGPLSLPSDASCSHFLAAFGESPTEEEERAGHSHE